MRLELRAPRYRGGGGSVIERLFGRGCVWTVKHILSVEFVDEDEDIVDADSQNEERDDLGDDESHFDTKCGEQSDRSRDG